MPRNKLEVWDQLKRQFTDDPRFIVGTFVDHQAIEVFVKDIKSKRDVIMKYIEELTKDVAVVSERGKLSIVVELTPDADEEKLQKEECKCAND